MNQFVYRVENKHGYGPYRCFEVKSLTAHNECESHPGPWTDSGLCKIWSDMKGMEASQFHFGFDSMEQLDKWFTMEQLAELQENEFFIVKIPVSQIETLHRGEFQVIFKIR